jgi:hypothetical protein
VRWASQRNFPREERENAFVPRLWATQRIGWLAAEKRRSGGSTEVDDEIRRLGERFGIPTEFTSYLVLEPGMVAGPIARQRRDGAANRLQGVTTTGSAPSAPSVAQFESGKAASDQRDAKSLAAADAAVMNQALGTSELRRAGAKIFKREGDAWADVAMKNELRVYKVKAYSRSYFTLLERIPELRESFAIGDRVVVAGKAVAIQVVTDGEELSESDVNIIVRSWH